MIVEFLKRFSKDLEKINDRIVLSKLPSIIENVKNAASIAEIPNIKKIKGFANAYRVRVGDYRIGLFIEEETAEFARLLHRKDIYKLFP